MWPEGSMELLRRWREHVWNGGRLDLIEAMVGPDWAAHVPGSPDFGAGPAGARRYVAFYRDAFPDIHFTCEDEVVQGDKVATRWTARGTHRGPLMGISPTGRVSITKGMSIYRIREGKIREEWSTWDTLGVLRQLGIIPLLPGEMGHDGPASGGQ
jgi:steroid delta-isomerase-like uncharacterized protein